MPFSSLIVLSPQNVINKPTYPLDMHRNKWTYNHDVVITHLEPDILDCEVKWALESITMNKASEVMEFQLSYFISWKMMI